MKNAKLVGILVLSLLLVLVVAQNTEPVEAQFLWIHLETPMIILLILTTVGGFMVGLLVALLLLRGRKGGTDLGKGKGRGGAPPERA